MMTMGRVEGRIRWSCLADLGTEGLLHLGQNSAARRGLSVLVVTDLIATLRESEPKRGVSDMIWKEERER